MSYKNKKRRRFYYIGDKQSRNKVIQTKITNICEAEHNSIPFRYPLCGLWQRFHKDTNGLNFDLKPLTRKYINHKMTFMELIHMNIDGWLSFDDCCYVMTIEHFYSLGKFILANENLNLIYQFMSDKAKEVFNYQLKTNSIDIYELLTHSYFENGVYRRNLNKEALSSHQDMNGLVKKLLLKEISLNNLREMNNSDLLYYGEYCYIYVFNYFYELAVEILKENIEIY